MAGEETVTNCSQVRITRRGMLSYLRTSKAILREGNRGKNLQSTAMLPKRLLV